MKRCEKEFLVAVGQNFCALDGIRSVENRPGKGRLELWYKNEGKNKSVLLNDFEEAFLHDLYNT